MAKKTAPAGPIDVPKRPRTAPFQEMEDTGIAEIDRAGHAYADARDERIRMGEEEQRRHQKLLAVMAAHGRKAYRHRTGSEEIAIEVSAKDATEKAKVKIRDVSED